MTDKLAQPSGSNRKPRPGLGRGLNALLGEMTKEEPVGPDSKPSNGIRLLSISAISPHPDQPRRHFDESALNDLASSISRRGLLQPIVVRPHGRDYQIVAGERRWRAAQIARLHEIPAIVRELDEAETLEIALVENIQRQDLNAIEEAEAYARLIEQFGHTQDALAKLVHKSRSHVANLMRLLELPQSIQHYVVDGTLSMGHARALIGSAEIDVIAQQVIDQGLSVRETERLVRGAKSSVEAEDPNEQGDKSRKLSGSANADLAALEQQLGDLLGLKVKIVHGANGGALTLSYATLDQLDMICQRLSGERI